MPRALLLLALLAAVCAAAAPASAGGHAKPMAGACATTFAVDATGRIVIDGVCLLTHLGRSEYHAIQTVTPNPDGTVHIDVAGYYIAANGDILRSSVSGTGHFTGASTVAFSTIETFTGGTGRFVEAAGTTSDSGAASFTGATTGVSAYAMSGSISY